MAAYGIMPDPETGGGEIYRDANGNPTFPSDVQNAYSPAPGFISTCELTALPANCDGRVEAKQVNGIVSEMLALAECWDPNGPWTCTSLTNLCAHFNVWWEDHRPRVDNISITGAGTVADPYHVNIVNGGTNAAPGPQRMQIRRTETSNDPPTGLLPGELVAEMSDPLRLWVGVPTSIDASGRRMLVPFSSVISSDTPPPSPIINQLWWESDTGIMWLWYHDGNSGQWVQVSSGGQDVPDVPTEADEIVFVPGGGLAANDVQEALIELDAEKVNRAGDTMTGLLTLSGPPTAALHAATKAYADTKLSDAPSDGQIYGRQDGAWVLSGDAEVHAEAVHFLPTGTISSSNVQSAIVEVNNEKIGDAPSNGNTYGRKDGSWVVTAAAGGGPVANAVDIAFSPGGAIAATNVQAALIEVDSEKLAKTGGTMTGALTLIAGAPAGANDAANKTYVDTKLPLAGGTLTGDLIMGTTAGANSPFIKLNSNVGAASTIQKVGGDLIIRAKDGLPGIIIKDNGTVQSANAVGASDLITKGQVDAVDANKVNKTGDTMTGMLQIAANAGLVSTGHVTTYGWGGDNNKGIVFLNAAQSRYLHFDGSNYSMPGSHLYTAAGRVWGINDFNYTPANAAGQAFGGAISAPSATFGSININGGIQYMSGYGGAWNQSLMYFNSNNTAYMHYNGSQFIFVGGPIMANPDVYATGSILAGSWIGGTTEANNGVRLRTSSGNHITFYHENPNLKIYVDGIHIKTFVIDHPKDSDRYLVHGCLEGPEAGVYYRGKGVVSGEMAEVILPDYFASLVDEESATVQVTPIMAAEIAAPLAASEVVSGRFYVYFTDRRKNGKQPFHWRVEATRKDVPPLVVEPLKSEVDVHGDGPYTYYSKKA
jgi:hypothetical protein